MLKCYFVRHGETDYNAQFRYQGLVDMPLNARGYDQVRSGAEALQDIPLVKIYSSPLSRALESARLVAELHGLPVRTLDWLTELDHGELEGCNKEESDARFPGLHATWSATPEKVKFPGGESLEDVALRCAGGLAGVAKADAGRTVAMVTHQVVIGVVRCIMEGKPLGEIWEGKLTNGAYLYREIGEAEIRRLEETAQNLWEERTTPVKRRARAR